jgi:hypothetical protein
MSKAQFILTTTSSVLLLVFCPNTTGIRITFVNPKLMEIGYFSWKLANFYRF